MTDFKQPLLPPSSGSAHTGFISPTNISPSGNPSDPAVQQIHRAISAAASQNTELLRELTETADAPGLFTNNETAARHARKRLKQQEYEVDCVKADSRLQFEKHKKFRDSSTRKLYYVLRRKRMEFDDRASTEEKLYLEALERRHKAEAILNEIQNEAKALDIEGTALRAKVDRHGAAHKAIDRLYASIFDGPTPGFPHEDAQENRHVDAKAQHRQAMERTQATVQGRKAAEALAGIIERAVREAKIAVGESQGRSLPIVIGYRLKRCTTYVDLAIDVNSKVLVGLSEPIWPVLSQAKEDLDRILEHVKSLPTHRSDLHGNSSSVALRYHKALVEDARAAQIRLLETIIAASEAQRHRVRGTARTLEDERQNLQQIRQGAFEQTVGFGEAAPPYHECCDRAAGFEGEVDVMCARITDVVVEELPEEFLPYEELPPGYNQSAEAKAPAEEQHSSNADVEDDGAARPVIARRPVPIST